ncbi:23S rRNA (guanine(745)-N(1))-methyltransferase [Paraferrimonas sp. SM1919]|uniref:23S rRNA (guanine(745)-N(1))-methyltransferase n=1 Tax=Paraferrimonas sp. SM1919 TaxID=2662263 RepID=UPI0013D7B315|nr:23S rRNA (guanine(745)-N(1))-methyltransferase [Paraferrimonas sp. SM1919]
MSYQCPLCQLPLSQLHNQFRCDNNHQFDMAKEGYVNLLPVQKKRSKDPGDNKEMMQARRHFLNQGFYQCLSDKVNQVSQSLIDTNATVLDLGCGEGYYSHRLAEALQLGDSQFYGLDISKVAVRYGAKRYKDIQFCVASAYETPFANSCFDLVTRIYAPSKDEELARIIKSQGYLVAVSPGPRHLFEIKQVIYPYPKEHELIEDVAPGFERYQRHRVTETITLNSSQDIHALLHMTPFAWRLSDDDMQALQSKPLTLTLDFDIDVWQRTD